jgi:hypothetical protein
LSVNIIFPIKFEFILILSSFLHMKFAFLKGSLLHSSLQDAVVHIARDVRVGKIVDRTDIYDFKSPMKSLSYIMSQAVTVYQYGDDIYICVQLADSNGVQRYYFGAISTSDYIKMLQPNSTEILEGESLLIYT